MLRPERRICAPPSPCEPSISILSSASAILALHAHHLPQRVLDLHELLLRLPDRVVLLLRARRLVDHVLVLAALDAGGRRRVVREGEPLLRLRPRHRPTRAVAARVEALRVALAAHDVRARTHAARDDAEVALPRPH